MSDQEKIRVLIVDDEERFREATRTMLERRGFIVSAAADGQKAVEAVRENGFDVVVLDLKMPRMDGHQALKEIKKISPKVKAIMLTGHGTPQSAAKGLESGVFDFLQKPCSIDILVGRIRDAFHSRGSLSEKEHRVRDIMVPFSSFCKIGLEASAAEAVEKLYDSISAGMSTNTVTEAMHRSMAVQNDDGEVVGIISLTEMLDGVQPAYVRLLKKSLDVQSSVYVDAPSFYGILTIMVRDLFKVKVKDLMTDIPQVIGAGESLMAAINKMKKQNTRRLLVMDGDRSVGIIREQDVFIEIAQLVKGMKEEVES